jgi:hypothetical protein
MYQTMVLLENLPQSDQDEIKRIITSEMTTLSEEEVRYIHARRDYLSASMIKNIAPRFREYNLFGYETVEKAEQPKKVDKKK